jgi:hypothetical protein
MKGISMLAAVVGMTIVALIILLIITWGSEKLCAAIICLKNIVSWLECDLTQILQDIEAGKILC